MVEELAPRAAEEPGVPWVPIAAGLVIVAVVVGVVVLFFSDQQPPAAGAEPPSYAQHIQFSDLSMHAAENFAGATVSYIEGTVTNTGDQTVTAMQVEVIFRNTLHEIVQTERTPLRVISTREPYVDVADLRRLPLAPGQSREFRLAFDHISSDWNQQYPELRILSLAAQ